MKKLIASSFAALTVVAASHATLIDFTLQGTAGVGLLFGNEPAVASGGSGGEIGSGITFDDVTKLLTLSVGWGSSQGFSDLSSLANNSHIHVTPANFGNGGAGNFTQSGSPVLFNLARSSSAVTGGTFTTALPALTPAQEADLMNGKFYINIHTANNGGGELRGFIVPAPVPEPATAGLVAFGALALIRTRRNRA